MKNTPFKMKGSPMKRNFGISPVKHVRSRSQKETKGGKVTTHMEQYHKTDTSNAAHPNYWQQKEAGK